jgi:spermidine synthase
MSGTAGLVYEVLWVRMIDKIIGSAPYAVAAVLTVFMGGLALGSFFVGRLIDRLENRSVLLAVYGALELVIGVYALVLPFVINAVTPLYTMIYDRLYDVPLVYQAATFLGCTALLIIPTTLMGGTLPVLCRYYVRELDHIGRRTGVLYGLNTIGAALGTLLCGFVLIPRLGLSATLYSAAAVNITAGTLCLLASRLKGDRQKQEVTACKPMPDEQKQNLMASPSSQNQVVWALVLFAVSGFCSMACQVFWSRLIGLLIGPTNYSFTLVVATFIVGLAAGSVVFGRLSDRITRIFHLLVITQIGAALFSLMTSQILGNSQFFFAKLIHVFHGQFVTLLWVQSLVLFALMAIPTFFLGAAFPLVNRIFAKSMPMVGRAIGTAYAVNTIGAILGSFTAGFILIPLAGKQQGLAFVFFVQFTAAVMALTAVGLKRTRPVARFSMATILVLFGVFIAIHFPSWNQTLLSRGWYRDFETLTSRMIQTSWLNAFFAGPDLLAKQREGIDVVFQGEGVGGFTTVERETTSVGAVEYAMFNSGKADASSHGDRSTQTLSGHIPMLFHPHAKKVMVLGLASGMTPGEVLHYPVERLDILEINDQVVAACRKYFGPYNNRCLEDPRTRLIVQDGRNHLALTGERYDAIISEPSNPWMAGLANLYTRDFFLLVKNRLTGQGLFAQWIQSYEMDWDTFALLGRTFTSVFPGGVMIKIGPVDYMLLARADDKTLDWNIAQSNIVHAQKSKNAAFADAGFLAHLVVTEDLNVLFGNGPIHTDNMPHLEFSAPRHLFDGHLDIERKAAAMRRLSQGTLSVLESHSRTESMLDLMAFSASVNAPLFSVLDFKKLSGDQKNRYLAVTRDFCGRESVPTYAIFHDRETKEACADIQIDRIRGCMAKHGARKQTVIARDHYNLALALIASGRGDEAKKELEATLRLDSMHFDGVFASGLLHAESGQWLDASSCFQKAVGLSPGSAQAHRYLGMAEARQGLWNSALTSLSRALALNPDDVAALNERGAIFLRLNMADEAIRDFTQALILNPQDAESHNSMAMALSKKGNLVQAAAHLNEALKISPGNENVRYNLALIERRIGNS